MQGIWPSVHIEKVLSLSKIGGIPIVPFCSYKTTDTRMAAEKECQRIWIDLDSLMQDIVYSQDPKVCS